eukprot:c6620_g1_i1.p1 GENE.c6620_g1_i1~~c6620_g1_i1.p1  ORF type:complete len:307 (-),score=60.53 c6620_g1_i1:46-966(-)
MAAQLFRDHVRSFLSEITVRDLGEPTQSLVVIKDEDLTQAFQKLLDHRLLSAPVLNHTGDRYVGFLDIRALVSSIVSMSKAQSKSFELGDFVAQLTKAKSSPDHLHVWTPEYVAKINPIQSVTPDDNLLLVCEKFAKGTKRVAVVEGNGHLVRIVSQSWLIEKLAQSTDPVLGAVTLAELGVTPKKVLGCTPDKSAIEAFELMDRHHVSAIALLDEDNHLLGQVTPDNLHHFLRSEQLKELNEPLSTLISPNQDEAAALSVTLESKLTEVFAALHQTKSHRLFIVDNDTRVIGVLSLKDILAAILK